MEVRILKKEDQLDLYKLETIAFVAVSYTHLWDE